MVAGCHFRSWKQPHMPEAVAPALVSCEERAGSHVGFDSRRRLPHDLKPQRDGHPPHDKGAAAIRGYRSRQGTSSKPFSFPFARRSLRTPTLALTNAQPRQPLPMNPAHRFVIPRRMACGATPRVVAEHLFLWSRFTPGIISPRACAHMIQRSQPRHRNPSTHYSANFNHGTSSPAYHTSIPAFFHPRQK
jgi:hypothetical protein